MHIENWWRCISGHSQCKNIYNLIYIFKKGVCVFHNFQFWTSRILFRRNQMLLENGDDIILKSSYFAVLEQFTIQAIKYYKIGLHKCDPCIQVQVLVGNIDIFIAINTLKLSHYRIWQIHLQHLSGRKIVVPISMLKPFTLNQF